MTSPKLEAMFANRRTETQAKRDRHAKRMRALFASIDPLIGSEEFRYRMTELVDYAHYDDNYTKRDVLGFMFKDLRTNLKVAKGNWETAMGYMDDDAYSERCRQGYDDMQESRFDVDMQREMRAG